MKKGNIKKFKLSPKKLPKSDWRAFDAMSEEQRHRAALSDPDAPPATAEELARARRVPSVRALRKKLKLTEDQLRQAFFRYRSRLGARRTPRPDKAAQILLRSRHPDACARSIGWLEVKQTISANGSAARVDLRQQATSTRTNNVSARALRPSVISSVTDGFRSDWGANVYADLCSIVATGRLNGRSPFLPSALL
jgi:putative transcriptional regulator